MKRTKRIFRNLTGLQEAKRIFDEAFEGKLTRTQVIPVRQALGRVLSGPVLAKASVPAYHAAAMDGLAVRATETFGAQPETPVFLQTGDQAIAINTGEPLPEQMDAVVMIENVEESDGVFEVRQGAHPWQHVRKAGEDIVQGEILLPARRCISAYDQAALLAARVLDVEVYARPTVLIVSTGDEIVRPEDASWPLQPGAILEVNGQMLASLAQQCGAVAEIRGPISNQEDRLKEALDQVLDEDFDLVLVIAGSSAGSKDFTPSLLERMGTLLVHGVTVMPGKPTLLASVKGRPVVGVPGYPVSAVVCFREFVRPLLFRMQGMAPPAVETVSANLARKLPSKLGLEEHVRVAVGRVGARFVALPIAGGAGVMTSLVRSDGILRVPQQVDGLAEGSEVQVELHVPAEVPTDRLLVIGSHDLTIDLLGSMIRERSNGLITLASSNVGSLSGLVAIGKGIGHAAGSLLLDTQTGQYNVSYVQQYLRDVPVALVTLVHRWQGLIVARGNPKNILGVEDLRKEGVSIINRQPGSGTRILFDHELKRGGIEPGSILGYRNEEYTHMSVAVAIDTGRADAGLGIAAAARALDLDFVPVSKERYDLVIPESFLDDPKITMLLEIVRSEAFKQQVLEMGGYEVAETGTIAFRTSQQQLDA